MVAEDERLSHLRALMQTFLSTMSDIGAETWIMYVSYLSYITYTDTRPSGTAPSWAGGGINEFFPGMMIWMSK